MPKSKQEAEVAVWVTQFLSERGPRIPPLSHGEIEFLKAFNGLDAPYTIAEGEQMFPGLYFPVKH
jgi:hypothetical protein